MFVLVCVRHGDDDDYKVLGPYADKATARKAMRRQIMAVTRLEAEELAEEGNYHLPLTPDADNWTFDMSDDEGDTWLFGITEFNQEGSR